MLQSEEFYSVSTTKIGCYYKLVGYTDRLLIRLTQNSLLIISAK